MAKIVFLMITGLLFMFSVIAGFLAGKSMLSVMTFSLIIYAAGVIAFTAAVRFEGKKNKG